MEKNDLITRALQAAVDEKVFPGAVLFVRYHGNICYHQAVGVTSALPSQSPTSLKTIYDLASLTKPLATGTGVLCLVQDGLLELDQPIESIVQVLRGKPVARATMRDLLCHRSGLPAWRSFYEAVALENNTLPKEHSVNHVLKIIAEEPLEYEPKSQSVYSDLGFIFLGLAIETVTKQSLRQYCADRMFNPLQATPLSFFDDSHCQSSQAHIAPTEQDFWRGRMLHGEVHDQNAYVLGGAAGHAGLFGTAQAVSVMTKAWLEAYLGRDVFLDAKLVRQFTSRQGEPKDSSWALGWDTPSTPSSSGVHFSSSSFGHLGFTGTSIWIDPEVELEVILLSNRVNPTRENNKIRQFRPMIHDVVYETIVMKETG